MKVRMQHLLVASFTAALFPTAALAQEDADHSATIENALSAAPPAIAEGAAVVDGDGNVLREGSNGYTCMPDNPDTPGNSPMCLDEAWLVWATAWMNGEEAPVTETVSFAYMLQGDSPVSNTDPWATEPTDDNEWVENAGPHIMILAPASALEGLTHDPNYGGPWVMWRGTSLAHIMVPTAKRK